MILRINLGMENAEGCGLDYLNLVALLNLSIGGVGSVTSACSKLSDGGDWEPENILIAEIRTNAVSIKELNKRLESLALVLNEDSIAVSVLGDEGYLVFNPNYTGEKYDFNIDYFTE
tara:strand:- start:1000 stop:1350 length:351 start_codon:yes stop_codon:yes gene_type:complete